MEQMESYGIFELTRQQAEEKRKREEAGRRKPDPVYAKGSVEYERQQEELEAQRRREAGIV